MSELSDKLWERLPPAAPREFSGADIRRLGTLSHTKSYVDAIVDGLSTIADITPKPDPCEAACQKAWDALPTVAVDISKKYVGDGAWLISPAAFIAAFRLGYDAKGAT